MPFADPRTGLGRAPGNRGRRYPPDAPTPEEVLAVLAALGGGRAGARNRALVAVMYRAGLRVFEALALRAIDVDLNRRTITVLRGKKGNRRTVGIDQGGAELIRRWLEVRGSGPGPLFTTRSGRPMSTTQVRALLHRAAARAGVERRIHPHGLRHAFAAELAREGVGIIHISRLLGHRSLATTEIYLRTIAPEESMDAARDRQWAS